MFYDLPWVSFFENDLQYPHRFPQRGLNDSITVCFVLIIFLSLLLLDVRYIVSLFFIKIDGFKETNEVNEAPKIYC